MDMTEKAKCTCPTAPCPACDAPCGAPHPVGEATARSFGEGEPPPAVRRATEVWMLINGIEDDFWDAGELRCTSLAEEAAEALDLLEGDEETVPEWVFDLPVDLEERIRVRRGER